jgi:transposase
VGHLPYIIGEDRYQSTLYPHTLDELIDANNLVRAVDAFIEAVDLHALKFLNTVDTDLGRPSYHPKTLAALYLYGYINGIRSSRRLEREASRNIELMWLLKKL